MAETIEIIYKQIHLADGVFDIIPVQRLVRCKDCKYNLDGHCDYWPGWEVVSGDDFCSRGERHDT